MVRIKTLAGSALTVLLLFSGTGSVALADESVVRAQFTSNVVDREPVDSVVELANDTAQIYLYTELKGLAGTKVIHRWEWNGQVMAEVPFAVGGDRWRVWSSKNLDPLWVGEWKASIVDAEGKVLADQTFTYAPPAEKSAPASEAVPAKLDPKAD